MDFKSFSNEELNDFVERAEQGNLNASENEAMNDLKSQYGDKVENIISKFQGMSEPELLGEVLKIINTQKQNGTFEPDKIKSIAQTIKPLLNENQQSKLEDLLKMFF